MTFTCRVMGLSLLAVVAAAAAHGQEAQWAKPDDPTAKFIIDSERQWAEAACTHNHVAANLLADDFLGTSPEGSRYTKAEEVSDTADVSKTAHDCHLIDARVRFFRDDLAMAYGSERSVHKAADGANNSRCLIWTDTWIKRDGKWLIIAAQDTQFKCGH